MVPLHTFSLAFTMTRSLSWSLHCCLRWVGGLTLLPVRAIHVRAACFSTSSAVSKCHSASFRVGQMAFSSLSPPTLSLCVCNKYEENLFLSRCVLTPAVTLSAFLNRVWLLIHANSVILAGLNSFWCFSSASSSESRHRGSIQSMLEHNSQFFFFFCG